MAAKVKPEPKDSGELFQRFRSVYLKQYSNFETTMNELQLPLIEKHGRSFQEFSNAELVTSFFNILVAYPSNVLLELGAHRAMTSRLFRRGRPDRTAIAIEANPFNFEKYRANVERNGTIYKNLAVTDQTGPVELILSDGDMDRKRGHTKTTNSILKKKSYHATKNVTVQGVTFDDLIDDLRARDEIPELKKERPSLWIDVEGALSMVLDGAINKLPECLMVFAEVEKESLFEGQVTIDKIIPQFSKLGFFPFLKDCEYHPKQYNIIFLNEKFFKEDDVVVERERFLSALREFSGN
ncbi:FkbM family methyltransferase [Roseovarius sp. EL26]|uniref:FkbM family methyltransferase n=1 Tax=Roseovarius sp. EL26 TaxID=2126672 RepID=UPI000EA2ABC0|nr:FkbM family methyltransferase [Roseovarius sp. EL26]